MPFVNVSGQAARGGGRGGDQLYCSHGVDVHEAHKRLGWSVGVGGWMGGWV